MKKYGLIGFICFSLTTSGQGMKFNPAAVGTIVISNGSAIGSAFVDSTKRHVITCAHVVDSFNTFFYAPADSNRKLYQLRLIKWLPLKDLAMLESDVDLCTWAPQTGDSFNVMKNQNIFYLGYSTKMSNKLSRAIVFSGGTIDNFGKYVFSDTSYDYIDFVGIAQPGYSGGPVYDSKGHIIAVIRSGYDKNINGNFLHFNRGISILPLYKKE